MPTLNWGRRDDLVRNGRRLPVDAHADAQQNDKRDATTTANAIHFSFIGAIRLIIDAPRRSSL